MNTAPKHDLNRISAADKHKSQVNPLQHDEFQQVPSGGTEPFFPLGSRRPLALIRTRNPAPLPSARVAPYAASGIIPGPLPLFGRLLPGFCSGNSPVVLFVASNFYNSVVLVSPRRPDPPLHGSFQPQPSSGPQCRVS